MRRGAGWFLCLLGALAIPGPACDAVPGLTFAGSDAGQDAGPNVGDAGADAFDAADAPESSDAGCPAQPPAGAAACCGTVPCNGDCDAHCSECLSRCSLGQVCCAKNNVMCHPPTFVCN